jgi:hypothetical protein
LEQSQNINLRFLKWRYAISLADLVEGEDNLDYATSLRDEARKDIKYIADHISDIKLRTIFLNQHEIRQLRVDFS